MAGITPITINMNIDSAGTAEQVTTDTSILPASVIFAAPAANAGNIYVGVSDVSSTDFIFELAPGESASISADMEGKGRGQGLQLSSFYVDAATANDDCNVSYMFRQGNG